MFVELIEIVAVTGALGDCRGHAFCISGPILFGQMGAYRNQFNSHLEAGIYVILGALRNLTFGDTQRIKGRAEETGQPVRVRVVTQNRTIMEFVEHLRHESYLDVIKAHIGQNIMAKKIITILDTLNADIYCEPIDEDERAIKHLYAWVKRTMLPDVDTETGHKMPRHFASHDRRSVAMVKSEPVKRKGVAA